MKAAIGTLVGSVRITQPQRPRPASWLEKKERKRKRTRLAKVASAGLEGFVDWAGVLASEFAEEDEISMLAVRFAA